MLRVSSHLMAAAGAAVVISVVTPAPSLSITVELAKKCRELARQAHPPQPVDKKTDVTKPQDTAKAQQEYFRICVARNGNMETGN